MAKNNEMKITALYERLSRDDEQQGESNSIMNQKRYLEDYARSNGFKNIRHFTDDGYTGTNFNRPGFNSLMELVEAGKVGTVIVKDMSRFGRNYLQVGFYTEIQFPNKGVRFIAINNCIDSDHPADNDFTPFLNIMNEWYAKDTSNKIKAVFKSRMQNGLRCSGSVPYGYTRLPGDKQTLVVDEEAAAVVRHVFELACEGHSPGKIADILSEEKTLIPTAYHEKYHPEQCKTHTYHDPYRWNSQAIRALLDRQEYLGHTVLGKTISENFKTKKRRKATPDELMIFPDTHEPIIDQDTWDKAQRLKKKTYRTASNGTYTHRLSGLIFCADCGSRMGFISPDAKKTKPDYDSNSAFQCGNYRNMYHDCASHFIKTSSLEKIIQVSIQAVAEHILEDEEQFIAELQEQWEMQQAAVTTAEQKELAIAKKRVEELDNLIRNLYEGYISGSLPERQYQRLMNQYDDEQFQLEERIKELEKSVETMQVARSKPERFIALIKEFSDFSVITDAMLYDLIEKVEVHEPTGGRTKYRQQQVDVYFNFIGNYIAPSMMKTDEERIAEIEAAEKEKYEQKKKRSAQNRKKKMDDLREAAKTDPKAAEEYNRILEKNRENGRKYREKKKAEAQNNPEAAAKYEGDRIRRNQQNQERYHSKYKPEREELIAKAEAGDPEAIEKLAEIREHQRKLDRQKNEQQEIRMAEDPEYAEEVKAKKQKWTQDRTQRRKEALQDLKDRVDQGDEEAVMELAEHRAYHAEASRKSHERLVLAAQTDPEVAKKLEEQAEANRQRNKANYYRKKAEREEASV